MVLTPTSLYYSIKKRIGEVFHINKMKIKIPLQNTGDL